MVPSVSIWSLAAAPTRDVSARQQYGIRNARIQRGIIASRAAVVRREPVALLPRHDACDTDEQEDRAKPMPPRFNLIPRDERFFDLFARSAQNTHRAAEVLAAMLDTSDDAERHARHLDDLEHSGDEVTHAINDAMNRTFVTPFDREDIGNLATALDDVTDRIEEVGRRLKLYRIHERSSLMRRFGRVILEQTEQMLLAVPLIESGSYLGKFEEATQEIHRLENEADDLLSEALGTLYDGITQVPELIAAMRQGEVYQLLESATDQAEHVAAVLQTIAAKNA